MISDSRRISISPRFTPSQEAIVIAIRNRWSVWSVQVLPTSVVIDPQGRARYQVIGAYDWDQPAALEALLALRDPAAKRAP